MKMGAPASFLVAWDYCYDLSITTLTISVTSAIGEVARSPSYYRARYYNPITGRFLSEDPIGFAGGINFYTYTDDSPTNLIDPSGEFVIYGNWCGPDWTGGRVEQYYPSHDLPFTVVHGPTQFYRGLPIPQMGVSNTPYYLPPIDNLDAKCETHDKCYYSCRANNKCDKTARKNCMTQCNQVLAQDAANSGVSGLAETAIQEWMKNAPALDEPNDPSCRCKK